MSDIHDRLAKLPDSVFGFSPHVDPALAGDFAPLIAHLRSDRPLTPREREFLALFFEGKITRPRHRPRTQATDDFEESIAYAVIERERAGVKTEAAVHDVMDLFRTSDRTVRRALARWRETIEDC